MSGSELLRVTGLRVMLADGREVVGGIDLAVDRGETLALVGSTGCGKTITGLALLGLAPGGSSVSGRVLFLGSDATDDGEGPARAPAGNCMSMVWQDAAGSLDPVLRIGDQVVEAIRCRKGAGRNDARRLALDLLSEVRLPDPAVIARRYPHQLSGGQRQRVAVALALAGDPALLIADEPTTALDPGVQAEIMALLRQIRDRRGMGIILVTHDLALVPGNASRLAVMAAGRIVEHGAVADVFAAPRHSLTRSLLAAAGTRAAPPPPPGDPMGPPALALNGLRVVHPARRGVAAVTAVADVSFEIAAGETFGLAGESGCGKTTLARVAAGLAVAVAGDVSVAGLSPSPAAGRPAPAQLVFQDPAGSLNPRLTVGETIAEACRFCAAGTQRQLLAEVGLPGAADSYPHELSGGELQRVAIARALAASPRLLVADEPTSSLDSAASAAIFGLLDDLRRRRGLALLLISHDLGLLRGFCHRVAVMQTGRILEIIPYDAAPTHPHSIALMSAAPTLPTPRATETH